MLVSLKYSIKNACSFICACIKFTHFIDINQTFACYKEFIKRKGHTLTYKRNKNERKTYDPTKTLIKSLFKVNYLKIKDIEIDTNYNFFIFRN